MSKIIYAFACLLIVSSALHVKLSHDASFPSGQVNIKADTGVYLARCNNCGPGVTPNSASIHETNPNNLWAIWTVETVGSKVAFKSDIRNYLSRCHNCWTSGQGPADFAFVHITAVAENPWALWTPIDLGNGKWAFQGDNGKFLARCTNCVTGGAYPDFAFVNVDSSSDAAAQWTVTFRFPNAKISIKGDNGKYLTRCNNCARGSTTDTATVSDISITARSTWTVERVGDKLAFKSDTGNYLARCGNCLEKTTAPNAATVHVSNLTGYPNALWTPVRLQNGKWAFQADNRLYLSRCSNCVPSTTSDFALVFGVTPATEPRTQWTVTNL